MRPVAIFLLFNCQTPEPGLNLRPGRTNVAGQYNGRYDIILSLTV